MIEFGRTDRSTVGRWWWTVDRWTLAACLLTMAVGIVLIMAASPAVADRIGLQSFHFVWRQMIYLIPALIVLFGMSLLPVVWVRRLAVVGFLMSLILLVGTLIGGESIKGARRWIDFGGNPQSLPSRPSLSSRRGCWRTVSRNPVFRATCSPRRPPSFCSPCCCCNPMSA
jgi:cell division protein FtsW (lipid II flippase)